MNKNSFQFYALFFFILSAITSNATQINIHGAQINYQLLDPASRSLASRIQSGYSIDADEIPYKLDFIPYHCTNIQWDIAEFSPAFEKAQTTVEVAREKLGHNRFQTFVNDCKTLFEGELSLKDKYALFILLRSVHHEMNLLLKDIGGSVEKASRLPDEQISFIFDFTPHRSRSSSEGSAQSVGTETFLRRESTSQDSRQNTPPSLNEDAEVDFSSIKLEGKSLGSSSFSSYTKQLSKVNLPVCLTQGNCMKF